MDTAGYDAKTAAVVAVDVADGAELWRTPVDNAKTLVPVGESVIVGRSSSPVATRLLDPKGAQVWERAGTAARLDGGNILWFAKALTPYPEDVSIAGEHLGDDAAQLGPLTGTRTESCSWGTEIIACAADEAFVLRRFAD